jgi:release factor glutamine methyltransferase
MKKSKVTIKNWKSNAKAGLSGIYPAEEAEAVSRLVAEEKTGYSATQQVLWRDEYLSEEILEEMNGILERLLNYEPLQYVLGYAWFYGLRFCVDMNTLIPRRETEELVDWVIQTCTPGSRLLDIGTGSGCIALAVKYCIPEMSVTGWDNSAGALAVARKNAVALDLEVAFEERDILGANKERRKWDVIVSNPPYVRTSEKSRMHNNVLHYEPAEALFVADEEALVFYEAIAAFAIRHLRKGGFLFFEINEYDPDGVTTLLVNKGFTDIAVRSDMQGKPRMVNGRKP